jgi:hypothetical protein
VDQYRTELKKAKIKENIKTPILIPDYRENKVLSRALDIL